jgi:hypothetical protein
LCFLEGRTQDEAAKQLGASVSTVRRRLDAGRDLLKARMTRRGATLGTGLFASFLSPSSVRAALSLELRESILALIGAGTKDRYSGQPYHYRVSRGEIIATRWRTIVAAGDEESVRLLICQFHDFFQEDIEFIGLHGVPHLS